MNIERREIADLTEEITITIQKEDYEPKLNEELRKYKQNANLKGFRKGKTPMSIIKRMYGKGVLSEIIQQKIEEGINNYLTENKVKILGQPLPAKDQKEQELSVNDLIDFEYKFELGLSPEVELQGLDESQTFEKYKIEVPDDMLMEEIEKLQRRMGEYEEQEEGTIEEEDLVDFDANELEDGEIKEKGWETYFSVTMDRLADEELKKELIGQSKGYVTRVDLTNLEKNTDQKFINRYYLNLDEEEEKEIGNHFEVKVAKIRRLKLADLNEEFYKQAFGKDDVDTLEKAKEEINQSYQSAYGKQADVLLFREVQDHLMKSNEDIQLPKEFLKRWLIDSNPNISPEDIDKEFEPFTENLKWNLLRSKIIEENDIQVGIEEVQGEFRKQIQGYFGGQMEDDSPYIKDMVDRMMQNKEQVDKVYEDLLFDKLFLAMEDKVTVKENNIGLKEFEKILEEQQKKSQPAADEEE